MTHVFISYAHVDGDFVAGLIHQLSGVGISCWRDNEQLRAGKDWRTGIDEAIEDAFCVIVVITPEAKTSEYVTYEWAYALGAKKIVIPVMLKLVELHPRLEALQFLDFTDYSLRPWDKLIAHLQEIGGEFSQGGVTIPRGAPLAVKQAIIALDSHNPEERKAAVESLAQMSHPAALEALVGAVSHPTYDVRVDAALRFMQLTQYKDNRVIPGLQDALKDKDSKTRELAAKGLGKIGDASAIPSLL